MENLEIGMLVNNVGMITTEFPGRFADMTDKKEIHDLINCNIMSMARMCYMVLPQMIQRKKGVIINVGSIAALIPTPMETLYGASKVYIN